MIVLRDLQQLSFGSAPVNSSLNGVFVVDSLRSLLQQRLADLAMGVTYDPNEHGYVVVAEPGDEVAALESALDCPILSDWFGDSQYGDADFAPACEWLDEHLLCFELGFVTSDNGTTTLLIVPKTSGIDAKLLEMCRAFARSDFDQSG